MFRTKRTKTVKVQTLGLVLFFCLFLAPAFAAAQLSISQATASSTYSSSYAASKSIDNGLSTYWRGASSNSYWWLKLDLGSATSLGQISIYWSNTRGSSNYNIQGSNNNSTWTNLYTGLSSTGGTSNPYQKDYSLTGSYRYIRIYINTAQSSYPIIYEAKLFGGSPTDNTPPAGIIKINNDSQYINSTSSTLNLSATDSGSGMGSGAQMQFSNDNVTWSTPEAYATSKAWTLTSAQGTKTVYVKFKDVAGNWSGAFSDSITLDATPPPGTVTILNDAQYAIMFTVSLTLSATDSGSGMGSGAQMQFSNDNVTWSTAESYATSKDWALTLPEGTKTVYVKFKDAAGNWSVAFSDTIIFDAMPPSRPEIIDDGVTTSNIAALHARWTSNDLISGVSEYLYKITQDSEFGAIIVDWTSTGIVNEVARAGLNLIVGKFYYFSVQAKDTSGHWSEIGYSDGIQVSVDSTPPIGTVKINNDAPYANTTLVTLTLSAYDSGGGMGTGSQMQFSNDNVTWSVPEPFATSKSWTLSSGDGSKAVYVKYKDAAGNWSLAYSDTIVLDTIPPTGSILINNGDSTVNNSWDITLTLLASDSGSGMGAGAQMQLKNGAYPSWDPPEVYATTKSWRLPFALGPKYVLVKYKDAAGNWSAEFVALIYVVNIPKERIFVYLNGKRIAMEENGKKYFYHNDHLGGTNIVTDESGSQVKYLDYKPYGETKIEEGSFAVKKKFTGKELDDSTGLINNLARLYDPKICRFISADPIDFSDGGIKFAGGKDLQSFLANPQNINRYSYCLNNPLRFIDPDGLFIVLAYGADKNQGKEWVDKFKSELIKRGVKQDIYLFAWGPANLVNFGVKTSENAKDFTNFINGLRTKYPSSERANIFAHSAASVLLNKALKQGLKVDNVIIAGSPIISDYKSFEMNTRETHSFESINDVVNFWISGWWNDANGIIYHGYKGIKHNDWVMPWKIKNKEIGQKILNQYSEILNYGSSGK